MVKTPKRWKCSAMANKAPDPIQPPPSIKETMPASPRLGMRGGGTTWGWLYQAKSGSDGRSGVDSRLAAVDVGSAGDSARAEASECQSPATGGTGRDRGGMIAATSGRARLFSGSG